MFERVSTQLAPFRRPSSLVNEVWVGTESLPTLGCDTKLLGRHRNSVDKNSIDVDSHSDRVSSAREVGDSLEV